MKTARERIVDSWHWRSPEGFEISTDVERLDFEAIYAFISDSYWARGISRSRLKKAIENSISFGIYDGAKFAGFARVTSDRASFAYLADVFVPPAERGRGVSKALMSGILQHPDLQDLRRWVLVTRDAHELYRKFGFEALNAPAGYMELWEPKVYERLLEQGKP
jgi:N-acetylglutamate synthase-like GNAT family acetyltransferase